MNGKFKIGASKDYQVWCLEEISDDVLWEVAQETASRKNIQATRYLTEFSGIPYYSFNLNGASFANIKNGTFIEDDDKEYFCQKWGREPKTCFTIDMHNYDPAAELAVDFVKDLQKVYKHMAFDPVENPDLYVFDDDIQKIEFIPSVPESKLWAWYLSKKD